MIHFAAVLKMTLANRFSSENSSSEASKITPSLSGNFKSGLTNQSAISGSSKDETEGSTWMFWDCVKDIFTADKPVPVYFGVPIDLLRLVLLLVRNHSITSVSTRVANICTVVRNFFVYICIRLEG